MARPVSPQFVSFFQGEVDDLGVKVPNAGALAFENLYPYRGKAVRRKGQSAIGASDQTPAESFDMMDWTKVNGTEYLIISHNGNIRDGFHATPYTIVTNGTNKMPCACLSTSCWIGGLLYIGNGMDANIRFNGTRVDQVLPGTASVVATTLTESAGGSLTALGTYQYKVAFVSADFKTAEPSAAKSITLTGANNRVTLASIPTGAAGTDTAWRHIYRTRAGGSVFYLLTTLADNVTTSYVDNTADASLTTFMSSGTDNIWYNTRFPNTRYNIAHQFGNGVRMIGAYSETETNGYITVYISNIDEPWYCPASPDLDDPNQGTRAKLYGPAEGVITGICSHGSYVAVFTAGAMFLLSGEQPLNFTLNKYADHGCVAHRTIQSTRGLLIWLGPDGVYQWDGRTVDKISDEQRTTIEGISAADMAVAVAWVWDGKYFLSWPNGCIYLDLDSLRQPPLRWGTLTNNAWADVTVTKFTGATRERVYAARSGVARAYQIETGATDAIPSAGTAIPVDWISRDWDMGLSGREKRAHWIMSKHKKGTGTATIRLYTGTGRLIQTVSHDISEVDHADETVSRQFDSAVEQARSEHLRVRVSYSGTAAEYELLEAGVFFTPAT